MTPPDICHRVSLFCCCPWQVAWLPDTTGSHPDLLATTGDYLRLWRVGDDDSVSSHALLNNNKNSEFCAPLTSFDWNESNPDMIGTSSIDTTCTIWNVEVQKATTQLIAHDKEVYDIAFARGQDVFASVGADGVRCRWGDVARFAPQRGGASVPLCLCVCVCARAWKREAIVSASSAHLVQNRRQPR